MKTHCKAGHEYTPDNIYYYQNTQGAHKRCRTCRLLIQQRWRDNNPQRIKGHRDANKIASRLRYLWRVYGLTSDRYTQMLDEQDGRCAVCKYIFAEGKVSVDHDHETGRVRGLLCVKCNASIGMAGESPERLENLAEYLREEGS